MSQVGVVLQSFSSSPSGQSLAPSHTHVPGTQLPARHWYSSGWHVAVHPTSSSPPAQSLKPSQIQLSKMHVPSLHGV